MLSLIILNNFKLISKLLPAVVERNPQILAVRCNGANNFVDREGRYKLDALNMAIFLSYLMSTELVIVALFKMTRHAFYSFRCSTKT